MNEMNIYYKASSLMKDEINAIGRTGKLLRANLLN